MPLIKGGYCMAIENNYENVVNITRNGEVGDSALLPRIGKSAMDFVQFFEIPGSW